MGNVTNLQRLDENVQFARVGGDQPLGDATEPLSGTSPFSEGIDETPRVWSMIDIDAPESQAMVAGMATVAKRESVTLQISAPASRVGALRRSGIEDVRAVALKSRVPWIEDHGEVHRDGSVTLTPALGLGERGFIASYLERSRAENVQLASRFRRAHPGEVAPPLEGTWSKWTLDARYELVEASGLQGAGGTDVADFRAIAAAGGHAVRMGRAYLEGGNVLTGHRVDGSMYAMVGEDSFALSKAHAESLGGKPLSQTEVLELMGADLGLPASDLIIVPQPGAFHLDMALSPWEPGVVLMNDARAAYAEQTRAMRDAVARRKPRMWDRLTALWDTPEAKLARQLSAMRAVTERRAGEEDVTAHSLEMAGLRVVRVPGRIMTPESPEQDTANFLNGEGGRGRTGQFFATAGGPLYAQRAFLEGVDRASASPTTVYFMTKPSDAAYSLAYFGSIGCRVKRVR